VIVNFFDFDTARRFLRLLLLAEKIMLQAVYEAGRGICDVAEVAVGNIGFEDRNDLVIGFVAVDQAQTANRQGADEEIAVCGRSLGEDADIERVLSPRMSFCPVRNSQSAATETPQNVCGMKP